jgi:hypothetical protein
MIQYVFLVTEVHDHVTAQLSVWQSRKKAFRSVSEIGDWILDATGVRPRWDLRVSGMGPGYRYHQVIRFEVQQ